MFKSEQQLVNILKENYHTICNWDTSRNHTSYIQEVNLGFGVADLVILKWNKKQINTNNEIELNHFDIGIYKIIERNKNTTINLLQEFTGANKSTINISIEKLIAKSYILKNDTIIKFSKPYKNNTHQAIAIEAKLKNWKRALDQAYRYKWFANQAYVVLDHQNINAAVKNLEGFKKLNVGLAEINSLGVVKIYFKPFHCPPIDDIMPLLLNEWINKLSRSKKE